MKQPCRARVGRTRVFSPAYSTLAPQARPVRIAEAIQGPAAPTKRKDDVRDCDGLAVADFRDIYDVPDDLFVCSSVPGFSVVNKVGKL